MRWFDMHLRFVIDEQDPNSGRRMGVFQKAYQLEKAGILSDAHRERFIEIEHWFSDHLPTPDRFALGRKPGAKGQSISWFRDTATIHLSRMWELVALLKSHGVEVLVLRTERPGYVIYEDAAQVVAYPFADTPT